MKKPEIELKKERDFSDVFNASFAFITQEIKRLFRVVVLYAGVPIILAAIMSAFYTQDSLSSVFFIIDGSAPEELDMGLMGLTVLFGLLAQLFIAGLVPAYLGEYEEKGKSGFTADDVWKRFVRHLGAVIGYSLLSFLIIIVGFLLFVIPGIYLSVPLSFILYVKIIEDRNFSSTFSRSFQLVSSNWWVSFGIILLAYLILAVIGGLFSFPAMIVAGIEGFMVGSGQQEASQSNSLALIITSIIGGLGQYILYPVLYIIIAFQYYNLREQKDRDTLLDKVSAINENE